MAEFVERVVEDLTIRIDWAARVGVGHCVDEAEQALRLLADNLVPFHEPDQVSASD